MDHGAAYEPGTPSRRPAVSRLLIVSGDGRDEDADAALTAARFRRMMSQIVLSTVHPP
jgi:hypothetical protein